MRYVVILTALFLVSCGRPLTEQETALTTMLFADSLDTSRVRLVKGAPLAAVTFRRPKRPRTTCRERILPEPKDEIVTAKPAAVALWSRVYFTRDWYLDNYAQGQPEDLHLTAAMLFGHEMTHIWQWQNRTRTGYSPLRAASEHTPGTDPYLFEVDDAPDFLSFGYEQQGAIMEEYICCRALDPQAPRTRRLHVMLRDVMPVADLPASGREWNVWLPWDGAQVGGICR